jgi:NADH dehydrogenase [ubiquinone] 1 alpha subcomplex assembly factor 7
MPGLTDVSAHIDFAGLACGPRHHSSHPPQFASTAEVETAAAVEVHGPVAQADWLGALGVEQRGEVVEQRREALKCAVAALHDSGSGADTAEEARRRVRAGWKRVVDRGPTGLGNVYKAMGLLVLRRAAGRLYD